MQNWGCRVCSAVVQSKLQPNKGGCPSGWHQWEGIGEVGLTTYSCSACGAVVSSKYTPRRNCHKTKFNHKWL